MVASFIDMGFFLLNHEFENKWHYKKQCKLSRFVILKTHNKIDNLAL